jgi:CelD/BcsL family acetyltransferase involved in cellulose biosynthesis
VWDDFVAGHPLGSIYHLSAWKRVLEAAFSHIRGEILVIREVRSGMILAGLPTYSVRSNLLGNRLVSIPFAAVVDPLVSSAEEALRLLNAVLERMKTGKLRGVEIRTSKTHRFFEDLRFGVEEAHLHHFLPLTKSPTELKATFSRTAVRRVITKAEASGITVREAEGETDLESFWLMLVKTRRKLGLPAIPRPFFKAMWIELRPKRLSLLLASKEDSLIAGVLVLKSNGVYCLEYAGHESQALSTGVIPLLYWRALERASAEGFQIFSFGRTSIQNTGLIAFKEHWGTSRETLRTFHHPPRSSNSPMRLNHSRVSGWVGSFVRNSPVVVSEWMGRLMYRHWG